MLTYSELFDDPIDTTIAKLGKLNKQKTLEVRLHINKAAEAKGAKVPRLPPDGKKDYSSFNEVEERENNEKWLEMQLKMTGHLYNIADDDVVKVYNACNARLNYLDDERTADVVKCQKDNIMRLLG